MTEMPLDRDLRDLFERGPARAPALTIDAAIATASALPQRHARFGRLDRRAWPPVARSASDPGVRRGARLVFAALVIVAVALAIAVGARLLDRPPSIRLDPAGSIDAVVLGPSAKLWPDGRILIEGQSGTHYLFDTARGTSERLTFGSGVERRDRAGPPRRAGPLDEATRCGEPGRRFDRRRLLRPSHG